MKSSDSWNTMRTLRTFIAIPIPEKVILFLNKIQGEIKKEPVKSVMGQDIFNASYLEVYREYKKENINKIIQAMQTTAGACEPFTLSAEGVGVFPGIKKARVIWSGVGGQIDQLGMAQKILEKNLEQEGFVADKKRFSPHFTLGRFKDRVDKMTLKSIIQQFQSHTSDPYLIKSMVLFKSDLKPSGAIHTPLFETEFTGIV